MTNPLTLPAGGRWNLLAGLGYVRQDEVPPSPQTVAGRERVPTALGLPYDDGLNVLIPALPLPRLTRLGIADAAGLHGQVPGTFTTLVLKLPRWSVPVRGTRAVSLTGSRQSDPSRMSQAAVPPVFFPTTWR